MSTIINSNSTAGATAMIRHVQNRFYDSLSAMDKSFTLADIEATMQRDNILSAVEQFVATGSPPCIFLFVTMPSSVEGEEMMLRDEETMITSHPTTQNIELLLFSTSVVSLENVRRVFYCMRVGGGSNKENLGGVQKGNNSAAPQQASGGGLTPQPPKALKESDLMNEILMGSVHSNVLHFFANTYRELLGPVVQHLAPTQMKNQAMSAGRFLMNAEKIVEENAHHFDQRVDMVEEIVQEATSKSTDGISISHAASLLQQVTCTTHGYHKAANDFKVATPIQKLFDSWCTFVEKQSSRMNLKYASGTGAEQSVSGGKGGGAISSSPTTAPASSAFSPSSGSQQRQQPADALGPFSEISAWKEFELEAKAILERAKSHEVSTLIKVLNISKPDLSQRWKAALEVLRIAATEACDVLKFLDSIARYFQPFYNEPPREAKEHIQALIGNLHLLHSFVEYYKEDEHIKRILVLSTNQIITCCKHAIRAGGRVWDQAESVPKLETMIQIFRDAVDISRSYRNEYALKSFGIHDLNELQIFGKLELFVTRINKMSDVFSTVLTFRKVGEYNLDGVEELLGKFFTLFEDLRRKSGDPLDYTKPGYDKDYFEFKRSVAEIDCSVQVYVNSCFESVPNTVAALKLLKKFEILLQRESIRADLQAKYLALFQGYGRELEAVQRSYENSKSNPPVIRDMPPMAGRVLWARLLHHQIEAPMKIFQESRTLVIHHRETKKIVKLYNRIASALVEYEEMWVMAWKQSVDEVRLTLQTTVVVPNEMGGYVCNFDHKNVELFRETQWLLRVGVDVPPAAKELQRRRMLPVWANQLNFLFQSLQNTMDKISTLTHLRDAMEPHVQQVQNVIQPGLSIITWQSVSIPSYIQKVSMAIDSLESIVARLLEVLENRIESNLHQIYGMPLTYFAPTSEDWSPLIVQEFNGEQSKMTEIQCKELDAKNEEIRGAVLDLCRIIDPDWVLPSGIVSSLTSLETCDELTRVYVHFNRRCFKALLGATTQSLHKLKSSIGIKTQSGFLLAEKPFFEAQIELVAPFVILSPSIEDIQTAVNQCASSVLKCAKHLGQWDGVKGAYSAHAVPFFEEISHNKEVVKVVLLLTAAVFDLQRQVDDFLNTFSRFEFLWKKERNSSIKNFLASSPSLEEFEKELHSCSEVQGEIDLIPEECVIGSLQLKSQGIKVALSKEVFLWQQAYGTALHASVDEKLQNLLGNLEGLHKRVSRPLSEEVGSIKEELTTIEAVRDWEWKAESQLQPLDAAFSTLLKYNIKIPSDSIDRISEMRSRWKKLRRVVAEREETIGRIQHCYKRQLIDNVNKFSVEILCFRNDYEVNGPAIEGLAPMEAIERLKRVQRALDDKLRRWKVNIDTEEAFGLVQHRYPELAKTAVEIYNLDRLYTLYLTVTEAIYGYQDVFWCELKLKDTTEEVTKLQDQVKRLPGAVKHWPAYHEMKKLVDDFLELQPVIEQLSHPSVRERHWKDVMKLCGKTWKIDRHLFKLRDLMEADLLPFKDDIMDLAMASEKEGDLENRLNNIAREWKEKELSFAEFKHRGLITLKGDDTAALKEALEETLVLLGSTIASRYIAPFRAEAHSWSVKLTTISEVLTQWVEVQSLWMYLEAVFASGDIMKQLPAEAKRFAMIDKQWVKIFYKATEVCNVVDFCFGNDILKSLPYLKEQLEVCQRALAHYLETKRNAFARFFFVSDSVLLEILSQASDPHAMQPYLSSIFDGLTEVSFESNSKKPLKIKGIHSFEGEMVPLVESVVCDGNIEDWLHKLCEESQRTIRCIMREAVGELMSIRSNIELLTKYFYGYPAQVVVTALQILWTMDVSQALLTNKASTKKELSAQLSFRKELLADQVRLSLSPWTRVHIQTLITMAVHNQELWEQQIKKNAKDVGSFEWQKQLRFYWTERDRCVLRIADGDIYYCDEYLGIKERLVITPLTDRCYTTLSQALTMYMGGAPAGPAGTGKTETVKDLGRAAGKYMVVFNCSDQWDFRSLGKIFKGLAQSGSWGCFDEFNRILLPVLSVVSQQVHTLFQALKHRKNSFVFTDGSHCKMVNTVGIFVTMNPGYAGRQELPENLKALFRGVSMMVPDSQVIMKTKLAAAGYKTEERLSRKFKLLYQLCEQQLSGQRHYDFGLRNILSVLRSAGDILRASPGKDEESVFMRTVKDMNLSKLVFDDVDVFKSLLQDLFPRCQADKASYPALKDSLMDYATQHHLKPTDKWLNKCFQIYETKMVRHGLMVVGPAGGGKTGCYNALLRALHETERKHREVRMNPKAITSQQMFGTMDPSTGDWFDGVFSYLWRRYNKERHVSIWLICDGPVDTIWVESLNTVLDDNKLLTLANGDRILMSSTLKMCFEVENLQNASPATVSRAGIIYLSLEEVGWECVYDAAVEPFVSFQLEIQQDTNKFLIREQNIIFHGVGWTTTSGSPSRGTTLRRSALL